MSYKTKEDTNDTKKGDNAKDEDDDDNDEIDKEISYENDHKSGEIDDNLLNLIIQTNAKLKEFVNLNNQWDTEMDHYPAQGEPNLRILKNLQHIKVNNKFWINNVNEFCNSSIFLTNDGGKSSQHLLSYILDGNTTLKENNAQTADHSLSYILNNDQEESLVSTSSYWTKELGESSKNSYNTGAMIYYYDSSKEHETEIKAACSKLSKNIFNIYETSLEQEVQADYMRKDQFLQTNNLVSADEGRRLYKEYKEKCKKERYEYLRNLYIGTNRRNDLLENEINDEKDEEDEESEEDEEDEKRIDLLF
ncbi:hypothetical protein GLOIN_2v1790542 [Rhizophagus irregularis DAOM 181602=DAOM 197198]|uniref:Uncharacterized protein n=1 Tax=Rhizophagus irregularis (strain DAOM 181602 / DAOM 197198 / MUCL 43194) TaxID=747089 RepID=A0A2P4NYV0_RHIID|nr:hypothetical protein GLOIN_2v1790542 [Rhizophagus irregularis DAOM 181602=DAOM 197198]POG58309.1 hypothetical protein GLOIN_2v1790542 [Rhizophagus irregularis DAOM 181602=DAOM 197198]|eukprot:XP_025165175.1 hypothetical protein GLOIN_2v1790542 [Rhizophagus irregularis DAOM 181602=DAOM 197198]